MIERSSLLVCKQKTTDQVFEVFKKIKQILNGVGVVLNKA